jgi:hypothetical protein
MESQTKRSTERSLSHIESTIESQATNRIIEAIGDLGRIGMDVDPSTLRAIRAWDNLLDHPNDEVRREAFQQLEESITAGAIPEEIGGLFESVLLGSDV